METPDTLHLDFQEVYEPAEDTFLLMDAIEQDLTWLKKRNLGLCVEVGSGSGVVSSAVCKTLGIACLTTDINPKACNATRQTSIHHGVGGQLDTLCGDLLGPLLPRLNKKVDILLFNPPYVPTDSSEISSSSISRAWAGGLNGREVIDRLLPLVPDLLSPQGVFYLLLLKENKPREIEDFFNNRGFESKVVLCRRAGTERLLILKIWMNEQN